MCYLTSVIGESNRPVGRRTKNGANRYGGGAKGFGQRLGPSVRRKSPKAASTKVWAVLCLRRSPRAEVSHPNLRTPNLRRRSFGRNPRGLVWTWVRFGAQVAPPAQRPVQGAHCTHLTPPSMASKVFWGAGLGAKVWAALRKIKAKESQIEMA